MPFNSSITAIIILGVGSIASLHAQHLSFEAESGALGSDYAVTGDGTADYIAIQTDYLNLNSPGNNNRVATYSIHFPAAGTYNLYARVRVGPGSDTDDSFFYGNGFGIKSPTDSNNWNTVNNLVQGGYISPNDIVAGSGTAGIDVWKWLNLSQLSNSATELPITFTVTPGNLTQMFQVGARENGLDLDKFIFATTNYVLTVHQLDAIGSGNPLPFFNPRDIVNGNLIQFNDNGAWCWYQDERSVVDTNGGRLIIGCLENGAGTGGPPRAGSVDAILFDFQTGIGLKDTLTNGFLSYGGGDDHNAPAFLVRPDGKYLAMYAGHNNDYYTFYNVYDPAGGVWGPQSVFDWASQPGGADFPTTYSNPHYLSAENRTYNLARGNGHGSQNIMISSNYGDTWSYGGELSTNANVGYVNGYFKYWDNGVDRIDFICTEYHPRDFNTSIYHGYLSNGMAFKTDGTVVDTNIFDKLFTPTPQSFTPVFTAGTVMPVGQTNYRCWDDDVCRYPDGTIECIITARINDNTQGDDSNINPDHAFFFCRYNGMNWTSTYLGQAGYKTHASEADYVGLGCLNPDEPNTIYISTAFDPRAVPAGVYDTNQPVSSSREIWKGITTNHGASFTWTPITQDSSCDNLRPIVPRWDGNHTALLWYRGVYSSALVIDTAVVGIVDRHAESVGPMTYVDATTTNTCFSNTGAPLVTGPGSGQWHERIGPGNGGSLLASADVNAELAPTIETTATAPGNGMYDVWVNFWGSPGADWRVVAGLSTNQMQVFRQMASQQVQPGAHNSVLVLTNDANASFYQAYLGRIRLSTNTSFPVFVGSDAIQTGTTTNLIGDTCRTWYDGVSYARVEPIQIKNVYRSGPSTVALVWNSNPPERSLTTPTYTVQKTGSLTPPVSWPAIATGIAATSGSYTTTFMDNAASGAAAFYRITTP